MNEPLFVVFAILVLALQIFLCVKTKKTLLRLLPAFSIAVLTAGCFVIYTVNQNWGFLIIGALVAMMIIPVFLGWLIGLIVRRFFIC